MSDDNLCPQCHQPLTDEPFDFTDKNSQTVSVCRSKDCTNNDGVWTMRSGLSDIPTEELQADLREVRADLLICVLALKMGVTHYEGGEVTKRLEDSDRMLTIIQAELKRRGVQ